MASHRTPGRVRLLGLSLAMAAAASLAGTVVVSAYTAPGSTLVVTQGCPTANGGTSCSITFHLEDANGNPECSSTVTFSVSGVPGSSVSPTSATTDCNGNVKAAFSAGNTGCGTATVTATSPPASTQTTVNVPCPNAALPNTSTSPPGTPSWLPGLVALALMVVAGCGLALRRMRIAA